MLPPSVRWIVLFFRTTKLVLSVVVRREFFYLLFFAVTRVLRWGTANSGNESKSPADNSVFPLRTRPVNDQYFVFRRRYKKIRKKTPLSNIHRRCRCWSCVFYVRSPTWVRTWAIRWRTRNRKTRKTREWCAVRVPCRDGASFKR